MSNGNASPALTEDHVGKAPSWRKIGLQVVIETHKNPKAAYQTEASKGATTRNEKTMKHGDSPDDIVAQLLAMKQDLLSLSFGRTACGAQQRKSPRRWQSPVEPGDGDGDGEFAQFAPAWMSSPPSDAGAVCHCKRTVGHTLHESAVAAVVTAAGVKLVQDQTASKMQPSSTTCPQAPVPRAASSAGQRCTTRRAYNDSIVTADDSAKRPAPLKDRFLRRSVSDPFRRTQDPECEPVRTLRDSQPPMRRFTRETSQHRRAIQPAPPMTRRSCSEGLVADDPAQRPAPWRDDSLARSESEPIKRAVRFNDTVEVKYISPPNHVKCGILTLRLTPNASVSSVRYGVPALCSLNCSFLTMAVESSKGAGFDKVMASIPIGDLVSTLFPGRFDMFRLSYTKGGRDDHVYCCNPAHEDKTRDDSSWMMEWLLVFKRTGVAVVAHSDARL